MSERTEETVFGNWNVKEMIGEGAYGKVYRLEREDFGTKYESALKRIVIPQSDSDIKEAMSEGMDVQSVTTYFRSFVEQIVNEFKLMSKLRGHTNIVSYEDHLAVPHEDGIGWDILIRMELLKSLPSLIMERDLTEKDVIKLGIEMCRALEVCGKLSIIHRDIKPENIFISPLGDFKLGDFGIARTAEKTMGNLSKKGTYTYMAPEVYKGDAYDSSVDIYSLGIVMYRLLNNNRAPFLPPYPQPITFSDRESSISRRMSGDNIPVPVNGSDELKRIVLKACSYRPVDRYKSAEEMRDDLEIIGKSLKKTENTETSAAGTVFQAQSAAPKSFGEEEKTETETILQGMGAYEDEQNHSNDEKTVMMFSDISPQSDQHSYADQTPQDVEKSKYKMVWYKFMVRVGCFLSALFSVVSAVWYMTNDSSARYWVGLNIFDVITGVLLLGCAGFAIYTEIQLLGFRKNGPMCAWLMYVLMVITSVFNVFFEVIAISYYTYEFSYIAPTIMVQIIGSSIAGDMSLINYFYFKKIKGLFIN